MKEEEYLFKKDVQEKSKIAQNAKKRAKRSGCRLPQYSAKELKEMSGPVYTLSLERRITYSEFVKLPKDLQKTYVQNILNAYTVGPAAFGELMGVSANKAGYLLRALGFRFGRSFKYNKADLDRFRAAYRIDVAQPIKKMDLKNFSFCFSGVFNPESFVDQIKAFIPKEQILRVSVAVEVVEPVPSTAKPTVE